jgi:hypothetical protein
MPMPPSPGGVDTAVIVSSGKFMEGSALPDPLRQGCKEYQLQNTCSYDCCFATVCLLI